MGLLYLGKLSLWFICFHEVEVLREIGTLRGFKVSVLCVCLLSVNLATSETAFIADQSS